MRNKMTTPNLLLKSIDLLPGKALVLRVCHAGRWSDGQDGRPRFAWPDVGGEVVAPDWDPIPKCGHGLHGWLWGVGNVDSAGAQWGFTEDGALWMIVETDATSVVALDGGEKIKFPRGVVRFIGSAVDCAALIAPHAPVGSPLIAGTASSGTRGTSTSGYGGTSTSGYGGTSTSGYGGTSTSGTRGTSTSGDGGTSTSGDRGTSTSGD